MVREACAGQTVEPGRREWSRCTRSCRGCPSWVAPFSCPVHDTVDHQPWGKGAGVRRPADRPHLCVSTSTTAQAISGPSENTLCNALRAKSGRVAQQWENGPIRCYTGSPGQLSSKEMHPPLALSGWPAGELRSSRRQHSLASSIVDRVFSEPGGRAIWRAWPRFVRGAQSVHTCTRISSMRRVTLWALGSDEKKGRAAVDEPKKGPTWLEWALVIALIVVVVIVSLVLLGPQTSANFGGHFNNNLWLHVVGL
jgi:hypothetical protein